MIWFNAHTYRSFVTRVLLAIKSMQRDTADNTAMTSAMRVADTTGLWLEFGVFRGNTLRQMSEFAPQKLVYGFDSFKGLPERWRNVSHHSLEKYVKKRAFNRDGIPPSVKTYNVAFVIGWFKDTLPSFLQEHQDRQTSFLHIDSDL